MDNKTKALGLAALMFLGFIASTTAVNATGYTKQYNMTDLLSIGVDTAALTGIAVQPKIPDFVDLGALGLFCLLGFGILGYVVHSVKKNYKSAAGGLN
jgi:hypothetical protein